MKSILPGLAFVLLLAGCTKQMDKTTAPTNAATVLKNQNISLVNISARQSAASKVQVEFSTEYEKNISSIEVYGGMDETLFCRIYIDYKTANSLQLKKYTVIDDDPKGNSPHYMIRYTTTTGEWFCSSVYKVSMK